MRPSISMKALAGVLFLFVFCHSPVAGQMRQIYLDPDSTNHINRLSFYSPNEGYVAFEHWIGYTTDSGRSYTKIYITPNNVNFNGYSSANWVVGFFINGVKAISKNILIVYGNYDLVPSILYSSD
ncbi:MAG TPA: hypothetical protein VGQ51_11875, partial [Puia sp.]|nr:hypothetical protein [Puia sp.]